jgi:hypothetical protein
MKPTKITKTRRYRISKKHPKRPVALMRMDLGQVEQQIAIHFPQNSKYINVEIPKEKNPDLIKIFIGGIKLAWYLDEKKGFIYDENGLYLGAFEKHDLKKAFWKIGQILKLEKPRKEISSREQPKNKPKK